MSYDKNYRIKCDTCGEYCIPYDEETPFGCKNEEDPEPYDPYFYCKKCAKKLEKEWLKHFENGDRSGYYQKSNAEIKAAKKFKLKWVDSSGIGMLPGNNSIRNSETWADPYQYISEKRYNKLEKLPYWGYCKVCGKERKGGYCSNKNCKESFENKTKITK